MANNGPAVHESVAVGINRRRPVYLLLAGALVGALITAIVLPLTTEPIAPGEETFISGSAGVPGAAGTAAEGAAAEDGVTGGASTRGGRAATGARGPGGASAGGAGAAADVTGPGGPVVGVTNSQIKLGFLLLDVNSIGRIGVAVPGVDPEQQREAFEGYMRDVNKRGGIHGRKLVGEYEVFDVLSPDDQRRACLALLDKKVFAIVATGGFGGPALLCVTEEGRTPLFNQGSHGTPTEYLRRSQGRLVTMYPHSDRIMLNWVAELDRLGRLKGRKIGIIAQETTNPGDTVIGGGLIPALKLMGYTPTHVSRFSGDQSAAASQIPVEVQQMQRKGVDLVMIATSTLASSQFVQTADNQGFRPKYTITDWSSMNNDTSNQNMPPSYDGTLLITTYRTGEEKVGIKENAEEKACREVYERETGRTLAAKGQNEHGLTVSNCTTFKAFVGAATNAGRGLTPTSLRHGVEAIGPFPMSVWGGGSFGPGKYDAADPTRTSEWRVDCRCLIPTSDFRKNRF